MRCISPIERQVIALTLLGRQDEIDALKAEDLAETDLKRIKYRQLIIATVTGDVEKLRSLLITPPNLGYDHHGHYGHVVMWSHRYH